MPSLINIKAHTSTRFRRIFLWLSIPFLAYLLIGFLIVPPVAKNIIKAELSVALKRPANIRKVAFNPLRLGLVLTGLKVDKLGEDGEFLSVGSLDFSLGISSIWKLAPVISYLRVDNFKLDVSFLGDGVYSISDLLGPSAGEQAVQPDDNGRADRIFPFALYGFEMTNATIVFDDRPHNRKHVISDLTLRVPFTSSFPDMQQEFTQPKFTAVVNGDPVELKGRTLPFHDTLKTEFEIKASDVDLDKYWAYVPIKTPLKLVKGKFNSSISLFFERSDSKSLDLFIGGTGTLTGLELIAPGEGTVLSLQESAFELDRFSLGDNEVIIKSVLMDKPFFYVTRYKDNSINWARYFPGSGVAEAGPAIKAAGSDDISLLLNIHDFEIRSGTIKWLDQAVPGGFATVFPQLAIKATGIGTHGKQPCIFEASMGGKGMVSLKGAATLIPLEGRAAITAKGLAIPEFKPYLDQLQPMIVDSGVADLSAQVDFRLSKDAVHLFATNGRLGIMDLKVRKPDAKEPSLAFSLLDMTDGSLDLNRKTIDIGNIQLSGPKIRLEMGEDGRIDLERLFADDKNTAAPAKPKEAQARQPRGTFPEPEQWQASVSAVRIEQGELVYRDNSLKHPAHLNFKDLKLELDGINTKKDASMAYRVSGTFNGQGKLSVTGEASLDPMTATGRASLEGLALRPLDGYLREWTQLYLATGTASADLNYSLSWGDKPELTVRGSTALDRVRIVDTSGDGEFAGIEKLQMAGIHFRNAPRRLTIASISLTRPSVSIDYDEKGHSNLRRALGIPEPPPLPEEDAGARQGQNDKQPDREGRALPEHARDIPKPEPQKPFFSALDIGIVSLKNGHVRFRDASVKPAYYAELTDIELGLIEIDQSPKARPKMSLKARTDSAQLSITGVLNPIITPIFSDLAISINGLELAPLSPYTIEYLAYPVQKGRLFADVKFRTADWELNAENRLFIENLILGPKDKRPNAPNVPIKFGMNLLQDGNGNMEIDLPIHGRLDDPNFHIGGIIFKTFVSLMFKTLYSPFSLIGSIFGGGTNNVDMNFVVFEPGQHDLNAVNLHKLETIIKAMKERERLKLELKGVIDTDADRKGLLAAFFRNRIKQQKYNSLSSKEKAETTVESLIIAPDEYEEYLFEAYKEEPDKEDAKPTTLFTIDRQPVEFMQKFIMNRITVKSEDLEELARRRAKSVKDHIINREPDLADRVFLHDRHGVNTGRTGIPKHRVDLGIKR